MRLLILAVACVLSANAHARGSKAEEAAPAPSLEQVIPKSSDWQWLPTDGVAPGLWVTHPPLEFAIDVLGVDSMQVCAVALENGTVACALQLSPCQRLVLPKAGKLRLELDGACMARQTTGVRLQLQTPADDAT